MHLDAEFGYLSSLATAAENVVGDLSLRSKARLLKNSERHLMCLLLNASIDFRRRSLPTLACSA